jgi:IS605 OrfB family transposase
LLKEVYPKKDKNVDKYDEIEPLIQTIKIASLEVLEKELSTIQKYKELDKLFNQLIAYIPKSEIKFLYKKHDYLISKIKKKERALSLVWEKIGFKRKDMVCKTAIELLSGNEKYLVFEDLNTGKMMEGFNRDNNDRYKFKSLRKSLGNTIYRDLIERTMLRAYKIGKIVLCVNSRYTSMDCSVCGRRNFNLKLGDKVFRCVDKSCGYIAHRDYNASQNIKAKGIIEYEMSHYNDTKLYNKTYKNVLNKSFLSKMTDGQVSQNNLS